MWQNATKIRKYVQNEGNYLPILMMEFMAIENSGRNHRDSQKNSNHEFVNCDDSSALYAKKQNSRASLL